MRGRSGDEKSGRRSTWQCGVRLLNELNLWQELFFDDLERPLPNTSAVTKIKEEPDTDGADPVPLITSAANGKLKLGKRSVAGIVISSGPGAHFATFEGKYF